MQKDKILIFIFIKSNLSQKKYVSYFNNIFYFFIEKKNNKYIF